MAEVQFFVNWHKSIFLVYFLAVVKIWIGKALTKSSVRGYTYSLSLTLNSSNTASYIVHLLQEGSASRAKHLKSRSL